MNTRNPKRIQQIINGLLILIVVVALGVLSARYKFEADWTHGNRNTLTAGSQKLLGTLKDPVQVLVFDYPNSDTRRDIESWIGRYQRFKPDVKLDFIDPSANPAKVKQYEITAPGEVVIEYQGRRETLRQMSEALITGALQRLASTGERVVVFLEGHGERSVQPGPGATQNDLTQLAEALKGKGLKVQSLNLVKTPKIPDNTSTLVIAGPTQTLLDAEEKLIDDYVARGGNLLWLTDPEVPAGLPKLAATLGIHWQDGVVIFPDYAALGSPNPAVFLATDYPPSELTRDFREVTAFPLARSVAAETDPAKRNGWTATPVVQTDDQAWLETGKLDSGAVSFDPKAGDIGGPLNIGLALTREKKASDAADATPPKDGEAKPEPAKAGTQRVLLFGDSDFLSDANLSTLANKPFALNLVQWLASNDAQLNIDVPKAPDTVLRLPGWAFWLIGLGYTLLLPALLLGFGVTRWLVRRRA